MKALILAAGMGTRLKPLTDTKPKSMIEVNGIPILLKQIDNLIKNGIKDIIVIAGYKSEIIINTLKNQFPFIKIIVNKEYETTNNMYSAYLSKQELYHNDFILMNADVFYDKDIITELLDEQYTNAIVVEKGVYNDENMKVKIVKDEIVEISKKISKKDAYGVSIDVYKFSDKASKVFFDKINEYVVDEKQLNLWTEYALNDILSEVKFQSCPLKGRWMEIDNIDDLNEAGKIFNE